VEVASQYDAVVRWNRHVPINAHSIANFSNFAVIHASLGFDSVVVVASLVLNVNALSIGIEQVKPARIKRERDRRADFDVDHLETRARGEEGAIDAAVEIEQRFLPERFDKAHRKFDRAAAPEIDADVLRTDAEHARPRARRLELLGQWELEPDRTKTRNTVLLPHLPGHRV